MDNKVAVTPNQATLDVLLSGRWEHEFPARILAGISAEDACRKPDGAPWCIGELLAHMNYWQQLRLRAIRGEETAEHIPGVSDWPGCTADAWHGLVREFIAAYAELVKLGEDDELMRGTVVPGRNVGATLLSHPIHNAYHLGQITLMRRQLGIWPPPEDAARNDFGHGDAYQAG